MHLLDDSTYMRGMSSLNWNIFNETREQCISESQCVLRCCLPPDSQRVDLECHFFKEGGGVGERGLRASAESI